MSATPAPLPPWHDLLAAITEMLDVPLPADYSDTHASDYLLRSRANLLRGYLRGMVDELNEPHTHADGIRRMTKTAPVTYRAYEKPEAGR